MCKRAITKTYNAVVLQKRANYGLSQAYLKERPLSASVAIRDFPLSSKPNDVVTKTVSHITLRCIANRQLHSGLL